MKEEYKKQLITLVFEKAEQESYKETKHALSKYLEEELEKQGLGMISKRSLIRYYDYYKEEGKGGSIIQDSSADILVKYLEYGSFKDFIDKNKIEAEIDLLDVEKTKTNLNRNSKITDKKIQVSIGIIVVSALLFFLWKNNSNTKQCMVWMDTHYELIDCFAIAEQEFEVPPVPYDIEKFKKLKRIQTDLWDTVSFFKNGKPNTWYAKTGNYLEFFTENYPHPVTGKALKPVTHHIIDKYIFTSIEKHLKKVKDSITTINK